MPTINITIGYLDSLSWINGEVQNFTIEPGKADVFRIRISTNLEQLSYFKSLLTTDEINRANRYLLQKDHNRFIVSRGSLRCILGKYIDKSPSKIEFGIGDNKKPFLINQLGIHFNVSHSADWVVIAVTGSEIGTDVEQLRPDFKYQEILADNFSLAEIKYLLDNSDPEKFFLLWTRKEALTKISGKGLDEDLKLIPSLNGEYFADSRIIATQSNLRVSSFILASGYVATIVTNADTEKIFFWDVHFNQ
jgi:4'-phosphopantetheinyl transferase